MAFRLFILTCLFLCQARPAGTAGISGSVLGFFFDPANGLQPILGITGASIIGAPVDLATAVANVAISPRQDYALAVTTPDANLLQVTLGDSVLVSQLVVPISGTNLIALSPAGSAAGFYDGAHNRIQVITGLPGAPALARDVDVSSFAETPTSLAINDGGDAMLLGFSHSFVALLSDGSVRPFTTTQHVAAAAFLSNSNDAAIADDGTNTVYLVRDVTGSSDPIALASGQDGITSPAAVAVSKDNQQVIVATSRGVAAIALSDGTITQVSCACRPTGLAALRGNAVFRLTEPSGGPMWLFDGDAAQPRIVFVPPYQTPQGGSQ
jgi:hypothetical protein